jgi:peptidoglycan/LPS O-acetylase OafA/YrhL
VTGAPRGRAQGDDEDASSSGDDRRLASLAARWRFTSGSMPEPLSPDRRYLPGLDGLRAVAVVAVLAYHLGFGWASGGLLGVGVFFTLSGYLITDLLLDQIKRGAPMREFWMARARRLLPALAVMLLVTGAWVWLDDRGQLSLVRGQVLAALLYMSNWWQSFEHVSYFARFARPSPLNHLWSLSVEEQFYLLWPWLLMLGVRVVHERTRATGLRPRLALVVLALAAGSAIEMALLYHPSFDPSRIYYGTDTRAFGLLFGASLACVWPSRTLRAQVGRAAPAVLDAAGLVGLAGIVVLVWRTTEYSAFTYRGGLVLLSLSTTLVLVACVHPAARLGRALGVAPLRWLGVRSYAIYLWQVPIITLTTPTADHRVAVARAAAQTAATLAVSALSWRLIEEPVRHGAIGRWWARARLAGPRRVTLAARWSVAGLATAVVAVAVMLSGALPSSTTQSSPHGTSAAAIVAPTPTDSSTAASSSRTSTATARSTPPDGRASTGRPNAPRRTSCKSVVDIGDSTSEGLDSDNYLPDRHQQISAQYARVGVRLSIMKITGGTSVVETLSDTTDGRDVAKNLVAHGYHGCWVIALGTNDAADVAVGSSVSLASRIVEMMHAIGDQPVLWVNDRTLLSTGPYAESGMQMWNQALVDACPRFPSMRVYDWAADAQRSWYIPDGIHYYSAGYAARARLIADALASAFPRGSSPSADCVVHEPSLSIRVRGADGHVL